MGYHLWLYIARSPRDEAVKALENGEVKVIFAVDIFNEGVDIPSLDTVMFLRPTESYVVFCSNWAEESAKYGDKEYLTVLDFLGNYKTSITFHCFWLREP